MADELYGQCPRCHGNLTVNHVCLIDLAVATEQLNRVLARPEVPVYHVNPADLYKTDAVPTTQHPVRVYRAEDFEAMKTQLHAAQKQLAELDTDVVVQAIAQGIRAKFLQRLPTIMQGVAKWNEAPIWLKDRFAEYLLDTVCTDDELEIRRRWHHYHAGYSAHEPRKVRTW